MVGHDSHTRVRRANLPLALAALVALSACSTSGGVKPIAFAPTNPAPSETQPPLLAALNGGVLPAGDRSGLSQGDVLRALEAEYSALERAPAGQAVTWAGSAGASGTVIPAAPYQVGRQNCRQYAHTATIGGRQVSGQGAACRNEDGSWTLLT